MSREILYLKPSYMFWLYFKPNGKWGTLSPKVGYAKTLKIHKKTTRKQNLSLGVKPLWRGLGELIIIETKELNVPLSKRLLF